MMKSGRRQRGAVTLMGALFIIVTMLVMVQAINRMAGSDITDSAAYNDTIEALFIAETGIEHASFIYANNGGNCLALSTSIGTTNAGRGSFDVTGSTLLGSDCLIRVQATASSAGVAAPGAAMRTVDAVLRLGTQDGWAVGDGGALLRWDGVNWTAFASNTTEDLYSVHCSTASDCWAVGSNAEIIHWDGASWAPVASGTNGTLLGVSCPPLALTPCYSVGFRQFFFLTIANTRLWNGSSPWVDAGGFALFDYFSDVSCTASDCFSTMNSGLIARSSTGWSSAFTGSTQLNGLDCAADDQCWAVGILSGNNYYMVRNNGGSWSSQLTAAPNQARTDLNAVSCSAIDDCWAVGDYSNSRYVLVHWDGSNWTALALQNGQHRQNLNGVHCTSANNCWAVGDERNGWNIITYNGAAWSYFGSAAPGPVDLNDVYVFDSGGGASGVSLVSWNELVN